HRELGGTCSAEGMRRLSPDEVARDTWPRKTFDDRPHDTTRRNGYRAASSGDNRRCPWKVQVTPNSVSMPKIRRCMLSTVGANRQVGGPPFGQRVLCCGWSIPCTA